jgi:hypothetical protein
LPQDNNAQVLFLSIKDRQNLLLEHGHQKSMSVGQDQAALEEMARAVPAIIQPKAVPPVGASVRAWR